MHRLLSQTLIVAHRPIRMYVFGYSMTTAAPRWNVYLWVAKDVGYTEIKVVVKYAIKCYVEKIYAHADDPFSVNVGVYFKYSSGSFFLRRLVTC